MSNLPVDDGIRSNTPRIVYILYLLGFALAPAVLVGLVLAYMSRAAAGDIEHSHYDFQIATFWLSMVLIAAGVAIAGLFGVWPVLFLWVIWALVRTVRGLLKFDRRQPMPAGIGWGFG